MIKAVFIECMLRNPNPHSILRFVKRLLPSLSPHINLRHIFSISNHIDLGIKKDCIRYKGTVTITDFADGFLASQIFMHPLDNVTVSSIVNSLME
jgi:hypothetical protein